MNAQAAGDLALIAREESETPFLAVQDVHVLPHWRPAGQAGHGLSGVS